MSNPQTFKIACPEYPTTSEAKSSFRLCRKSKVCTRTAQVIQPVEYVLQRQYIDRQQDGSYVERWVDVPIVNDFQSVETVPTLWENIKSMFRIPKHST